MSETVRQELMAAHEGLGATEGMELGNVLQRLPGSLLDAHIIRDTCSTCNGKRYVTGAEDFPGGDEGYDVTCSPCPDCADAPVYVVAPEAMDRAAQAACDAFLDYRHPAPTVKGTVVEDFCRNAVNAVLQSLLPGARVAKSWRAIGRLNLGFQEDTPMLDMEDGTARELEGNELIAILEDTREEAGE